jgi:protein gp37
VDLLNIQINIDTELDALNGTHGIMKPYRYVNNNLDWVICGCESGPGARPINIDWARSLRDQCKSAGVSFFLKQIPINGKLVKMPELDGVVWNDYPEVQA